MPWSACLSEVKSEWLVRGRRSARSWALRVRLVYKSKFWMRQCSASPCLHTCLAFPAGTPCTVCKLLVIIWLALKDLPSLLGGTGLQDVMHPVYHCLYLELGWNEGANSGPVQDTTSPPEATWHCNHRDNTERSIWKRGIAQKDGITWCRTFNPALQHSLANAMRGDMISGEAR